MEEIEKVVETRDGKAPPKSPCLEFVDEDSRGVPVTKIARPLGDRIMVIPTKRERIEAGGIIIPSISQVERDILPVEGVVVATGPGIKAGSIEVGDVVLYGSEDGVKVTLGTNPVTYLVLADEHVVAILSKASALLERDRFARILFVRNNWVLVEWEEATEEYKMAGGVKLAKAETYRQAHFTGIVKMVGPDSIGEVKEAMGKRVFFDRWAYEFREMCWYEPGVVMEGVVVKNSRYAFMLDYRLHCIVPDRVKITTNGMEEVPDEGPSAYMVDVPVKRNVGRVYG